MSVDGGSDMESLPPPPQPPRQTSLVRTTRLVFAKRLDFHCPRAKRVVGMFLGLLRDRRSCGGDDGGGHGSHSGAEIGSADADGGGGGGGGGGDAENEAAFVETKVFVETLAGTQIAFVPVVADHDTLATLAAAVEARRPDYPALEQRYFVAEGFARGGGGAADEDPGTPLVGEATLAAATDADVRPGMKLILVRNASQRAGLEALYTATGGDSTWLHRNWWCSERPLSEWTGIGTNADGKVVRIDLNDNGLSGELPPEGVWRLLDTLEELYIASNAVCGRIPVGLRHLRRLTHLRLDNNALTGAVPAALAPLTGTVEMMDFSRNPDLRLPTGMRRGPWEDYLFFNDVQRCGAFLQALADAAAAAADDDDTTS